MYESKTYPKTGKVWRGIWNIKDTEFIGHIKECGHCHPVIEFNGGDMKIIYKSPVYINDEVIIEGESVEEVVEAYKKLREGLSTCEK